MIWAGFGWGGWLLPGEQNLGSRMVPDSGLWFGGLSPALPWRFPSGAAQLWERTCLAVTPVGGWLGRNASGIVTNLIFFGKF